MTLVDIGVLVGIVTSILSIVAGVVVWLMRSMVAPLKVVVENNTKAFDYWMDRVLETLDRHGEELEDHRDRIVRIETTHEIEGKL